MFSVLYVAACCFMAEGFRLRLSYRWCWFTVWGGTGEPPYPTCCLSPERFSPLVETDVGGVAVGFVSGLGCRAHVKQVEFAVRVKVYRHPGCGHTRMGKVAVDSDVAVGFILVCSTLFAKW